MRRDHDELQIVNLLFCPTTGLVIPSIRNPSTSLVFTAAFNDFEQQLFVVASAFTLDHVLDGFAVFFNVRLHDGFEHGLVPKQDGSQQKLVRSKACNTVVKLSVLPKQKSTHSTTATPHSPLHAALMVFAMVKYGFSFIPSIKRPAFPASPPENNAEFH